MHMIVLSVKTW